jgi:hypothetical protein
MKIKQLIEQLQQFDPETMAVVAGYEADALTAALAEHGDEWTYYIW